MKKAKSPQCLTCLAPVDNQLHFGLQCPELDQIRAQYISKFVAICPNLVKYVPDLKLLLLILLDPYSPLVPSDVREGWSTTSEEVYKLSRDYFYDIHNKREKLIEASKELISNIQEPEDNSEIVIALYKS